MEQGEGQELHAKVAGQELDLKNVPLNTIATIATLIVIAGAAAGGYFWADAHSKETRDASKVFVEAIKDQTAAIRSATVVAKEQNCLLRYQGRSPAERAAFCADITR